MPLTPEQRALRARIAAHTGWARTVDPLTRTAPGRAAAERRFAYQVVDPAGELSPTEAGISRSERDRRIAVLEKRVAGMDQAELDRRVGHLRKAYFAKLALKSAQARRRGRAA